MKISEYIRDRWVSFAITAMTCLASALFLSFLEIEPPVIVAVEIILLLGLSIIFVYDYLRKKQFFDSLIETWESLEEKSYLSTLIKRPDFYEGQLLYDMIKENEKYFNDLAAQHQQDMLEQKDYIETWVHEIKTPLAVQELLIENNRNAFTSSLEEETKKIEAYVEQMLYYSKSGNLESDYIIQPFSLKKLVMEVIKKHTKMLVNAGVQPQFQCLDYCVLLDPKWIEFVLGQIVTNAAKYCDNSRKAYLTFHAKEANNMVLLTVADNGIGIPKQDIPKLFRKGFTGENGRNFKKSTGMGLYLCKKLCDKMQVPIELHSCQGKGTEVSFQFKKATPH